MTDPQFKALIDAASRSFAPAGRFARHFARGKLRYDPVFAHLLQRGLLPNGARVLDLGCGQGLLFALLRAAQAQFSAGDWPVGWPPPPSDLHCRGIELRAADLRRARLGLGEDAHIEQADLRDARLPAAEVIVAIDVLQYLEPGAQERLLDAMARALSAGGLLALRISDAAAGPSSVLTRVVDQLVALARDGTPPQLHCRTRGEWTAALAQRGLAVTVEPMNHCTPFANVLLLARKAPAG